MTSRMTKKQMADRMAALEAEVKQCREEEMLRKQARNATANKYQRNHKDVVNAIHRKHYDKHKVKINEDRRNKYANISQEKKNEMNQRRRERARARLLAAQVPAPAAAM